MRFSSRHQLASDVLLTAMAWVMDACVVLDELKRHRPGLAADWAQFKDISRRAAGCAAAWPPERRARVDEVFWCRDGDSPLAPLCGSPLITGMRHRLRAQDRWQAPLVAVCNLCATTAWEGQAGEGTCLLPEERYMCVRVVSLLLGWLDGRDELPADGRPPKHLDLRVAERVVARWPYIPLVAEMVFAAADFVRPAVHIELQPEKAERKYLLREGERGTGVPRIAAMREACYSWASRWGMHERATAELDPERLRRECGRGNSEARLDALWDTAVAALRLTRDVACAVREQAVWKARRTGGAAQSAAAYEELVQQGYPPDERRDLTEAIGLLHGIYRALSDAWPPSGRCCACGPTDGCSASSRATCATSCGRRRSGAGLSRTRLSSQCGTVSGTGRRETHSNTTGACKASTTMHNTPHRLRGGARVL